MNERIQELMKKAMEPSGLESLAGPYMELNPEKFAELILQECIGLFNYDPTGAMSSMAESIHNDIAVKRIQEHFGVK